MISLDKTYKTRDGRSARVICVDAPKPWCVVAIVGSTVLRFDEQGTSRVNGSGTDLVEDRPKHVRWINLCKFGSVAGFLSRQDAEKYKIDTIARIRVEFEEGQFDE
jgi:hypothetical protein